MSNFRKAIIAAAKQAGDMEYAAWLESKKYISFESLTARGAYYGISRTNPTGK